MTATSNGDRVLPPEHRGEPAGNELSICHRAGPKRISAELAFDYWS